MAINYTNGQLGITDKNGDINIIYPVTLSDNVLVYKSDDTTVKLSEVLNNLGEVSTLGLSEIIDPTQSIDITVDGTTITYNKTVINSIYKSLGQAIGTLTVENTSLKNRITTLENTVTNLEQAISSLGSLYSDLNTRVKKLEEK